MTLNEYLETEGLTASAFAEKAGISLSVVSRAIGGVREPGRNAAGRIVKATGGQVSYSDLWKHSEDAA